MKKAKVMLTATPFVWMIGMIPFVNQVNPLVFGLPFLAFWLVCGNLVTFCCLMLLYKIDGKTQAEK